MATRSQLNHYVIERIAWRENQFGEYWADHTILAVTLDYTKAHDIVIEDAIYPYDFEWINRSYVGWKDDGIRAHGVRYEIHTVPSY